MTSAPVVITGRSSRRSMTSVVRELACPASRAISSTGTPWKLIMLTNDVRSSFGTHRAPSPAAAVTRRKSRRKLCDS